jgi:hypothetical protein
MLTSEEYRGSITSADSLDRQPPHCYSFGCTSRTLIKPPPAPSGGRSLFVERHTTLRGSLIGFRITHEAQQIRGTRGPP